GQAAWVLNGEASALLADGGETAARRLRWAGIKLSPSFRLAAAEDAAGEAAPDGLRHFAVPVFHLEALAVQRIGGPRAALPADWDARHPLFRRLAAAAVKTVYALGLDYAEVRMAASDAGAVRVEAVT